MIVIYRIGSLETKVMVAKAQVMVIYRIGSLETYKYY